MSTRASSSKTQPQTQPQTRPQEDTRRSIVVGVDPHGRSTSAVVWAAEEAERDATALTLLCATRPGTDDAPTGEHDLAALARRLTLHPLHQRTLHGNPVDALLGATDDADLLVLGARTMRPGQRMLLGSTSRAVAAWSPIPVVVVPEPWMQPSMATSPVVAGIRPPHDTPHKPLDEPPDEPLDEPLEEPLDEEVLAFAFARAAALHVPLIVLSAFDPDTLTAWSPTDLHAHRTRHHTDLVTRLAPWRDQHPDLEVIAHAVTEPAHIALRDAENAAQLTVIGRHHSHTLSGVLGTTARRILTHATRPVAVIPSGDRDTLTTQVRMRHGEDIFWAPTF